MKPARIAFALALTTLACACALESGDLDEPSLTADEGLDSEGTLRTGSGPPVVCTAGTKVYCNKLSAQFRNQKNAVCRADGTGWDVSTCKIRPGIPANSGGVRHPEVVIPALALNAPAHWRDAKCNNGEPFDMQVRLAPRWSPQRDRWVIYLRGGGMCDDDVEKCRTRGVYAKPRLKTPRAFEPFERQGVLGANTSKNEIFARANQVFMNYCSSDLWTGSSAVARPSTYGTPPGSQQKKPTYFTGRLNLIAAFEILTQRFGLDDSNPATEVLFSGFSAGGHGVHANARALAEYLPSTAAARRLQIMVDGGWIPK